LNVHWLESLEEVCGFWHLSRFAGAYRDRFGALPSVHLARSSSNHLALRSRARAGRSQH
jgi:AraC-like DNA-binding protein